jgi:Xaa-Pro aminopeptidase
MTQHPNNQNRAPIAISDGEFLARRVALSRALQAQDIDAWVAFGDDAACAGPSHIRYLIDLEPHFEPVVVLRRSDGRELVVTGPETLGYELTVRRRGTGRVVAAGFLGHASEEYPTIEVVDGEAEISAFLNGAKRLGLIGCERMPQSFNREIAGALAEHGRQIISVDDVAFSLRAIKSRDEQAVIDEAYRIAEAGIRAAAGAIRPGVSERQVVAEAEAAMRREGAEGFGIDTMVASGIINTQPIIARSSFRVIQAEDLISVTVAPRYEGYHAALARPFLLRSNLEIERYVEVARDAQRRCAGALKAGAPGFNAERIARETVAAGKTGSHFPYVGVHSIGTVEFEPPIFASHSADIIQEGMALSIDIPLFHAEWGGFRIEDGYSIVNGEAKPRLPEYQNIVPLILQGA